MTKNISEHLLKYTEVLLGGDPIDNKFFVSFRVQSLMWVRIL